MNNFNLTEWALEHRAVVLFLIIVVGVAGVFSFSKLGQLEDPKFSVPSMTATVIWPGASAQQIQDEVLNRIEKKFEQLDHFEKVVTFARQGYGGMTITVKGGTSHKDQQEAWYQARKKFSDLKLELPDGVVGPIFNDEFGDVYSLLYAVKGDGIGHAELSDVSEDIKRRLLKVPYVKKVDLLGKQEQKVYVEFSHERLAALGITPLAIAESLKSQNAMMPGGSIDTSQDRVFVRVSGQFTNLDDIRNVPIAAGGRTIKLGDIATVKRGFQDPPIYTVRHNGQDVLMVGIVMTDDGNVVELGKAVQDAVAKVQSELPHGIELERVADQPTTVKDSVWEFERSLMEALVIVMAVSLLSLGLRTGLIVAISVPLVLGVVAMVMLAMGWNLERISLGSLIIALGLLVDDAIIAIEMMVVKMEGGLGPREGGRLLLFLHRDAPPVGRPHHRRWLHADRLRALHDRRIRGRHLLDRRHCRGVLVALLGHDHALPRGEDAAQGLRQAPPRRDPYDTPFYRRLRGWIDFALEKRWLIIGVTAGALVLALAGMKFVPQQFFPNSERPELILDLRMKEGSSFQATTEQVKRMEAILKKDEDVKFFTAYTGAGSPRFYLALSPELPNPGYAQFIVMTKDMEARERVRSRLMAIGRQGVPAGLGARHAPGNGPRRGIPGAVPRGRPRHAEGARDRPPGRTGHVRQPEGA